MKVTKAIIPVAGWGTRMLPITKAIEKCMLPVGTRPVIDYVVDDVLRAGIKEIHFVVSRENTQLERFYSDSHELNGHLVANGKSDRLHLVTPPDDVSFNFVVQPQDGRYGSSVPVGLFADKIADDELALVIMGDQFFYRTDGGSNTADLIASVQAEGATAGLLGVPVPWEDVSKYGVIEKDAQRRFVRIVEKPTQEEAPSNLNNASFYLFPKRMFELASLLPVNSVRGEYEITDPLNKFVQDGGAVVVEEAKGQYLDCGSPDGWLEANNFMAAKK